MNFRRTLVAITLLCAFVLCLASCRSHSNIHLAVNARADLLNYSRALGDLERAIDSRQIYLHIEKTKYRLTLNYRSKPLKSYPVVFGGNPFDDKRREGDRCTPEGKFKIDAKYPHRLWNKFMLLSYPTADSRRKFNEAKRSGKIRANATIGGSVGIHGVPDGKDDWIESRTNWTLGCISLKNADVDEIYSVMRNGTVVEIAH